MLHWVYNIWNNKFYNRDIMKESEKIYQKTLLGYLDNVNKKIYCMICINDGGEHFKSKILELKENYPNFIEVK